VYVLDGGVSANYIGRSLKTVPICSNTFDPNSCKYNVVTSLGNNIPNTNTKLYPNPAQNKITVNVSGIEDFKIYNLAGELVLQKTINGPQEINIESLKKGLYFVTVGEKKEKLIVE
jgi:hypothetical protein